MIWYLILFFTTVFSAFFVDFNTMFFYITVYTLGLIVNLVVHKNNRSYLIKIYNASYSVGSIYLFMCFYYMKDKGYSSLLSYDSIEYFIPTTKMYLNSGEYTDVLLDIWRDYNFFNRFQSGFFTYTTFFGYYAKFFNSDFYISLQLGILLMYCFSMSLIYKIFLKNNFTTSESYKYSLVIGFTSILFFYSSQILRDIHILFCYLLAIYLTFDKHFSIITMLKLLVVIFICCTFRIESGLFLFIMIPLYVVVSSNSSKYRSLIIGSSVFLFILFLIVSYNYLSGAVEVIESNNESYGNDKGNGVIGTLQKIPILGSVFAILYNAVQPIPFWSRLSINSSNILDNSVYNIMNFPRIFSSFFNLLSIVFILAWLFLKKLKNQVSSSLNKTLVYQLWLGFFFLFLQADVISQRRLIAYYIMFYIFFFIIFNNVSIKRKKELIGLTFLIFFVIQIVAIIILK